MAGYTRQSSGLIVAGQTIRAAHHNVEYNAIQAAFDSSTGHKHDGTAAEGALVPLIQKNNTSVVINDAGTGSVEFTVDGTLRATLVTPSAPTNGNELVTKTYADNLTFATALPAQTGNAGKFVTTNGTLASWAEVLPNQTGNSGKFLNTNGTAVSWAEVLPSQTGNAGNVLTTNGTTTSWTNGFGSAAVVTTSTALTVSSSRVQGVAMSSDYQSVTLPDATTLRTGGPLFVITNTGNRTFGVRSNGGTLLTAVPAGATAELYLRDNSTAAGSWTASGRDLQPALVAVDATLPATLTQVVETTVRLTDTLSLHFARNASGHPFVFAVDHAPGGLGVGTAVLINATSGSIISAFRISNSKAFIVCSWSSPAPLYNITVSGNTCTVSSGASSGLWVTATFTGAPYIAQCGANSDQFVMVYVSGGVVGAQACDASGTNPTVGTQVNIVASGGQSVIACYAISTTTAIALYVDGAASPYSINAVVLSVSGTTITVGTPGTLANVVSNVTLPSCQLSSTSYVITYYDTVIPAVRAVAVTVSGTTATFGSPLTINSGGFGDQTYTLLGGSRFQPNLYPLSSTTALATLGLGSGSGVLTRHMVLTNTAGVITSGSVLWGLWADSLGGNFPQASDGFLALASGNNEDSLSEQTVQSVSLSGTTLTQTGNWRAPGLVFSTNSNARFGLSGGVRGISESATSPGSVLYSNVLLFRFAANSPPRYLGAISMPNLFGSAAGGASVGVEVTPQKLSITGVSLAQIGSSAKAVRLVILEFAA